MDNGILYENEDSTILLVDIPRSLEAAQFQSSSSSPNASSFSRRLISSEPPLRPYPSLEPKSVRAKAALKGPSLEELLLRRHLEFALEKGRDEWKEKGEWCLPRITESVTLKVEEDEDIDVDVDGPRKRMKLEEQEKKPGAKSELKAEENIKIEIEIEIDKIPCYSFPLSSHAHKPVLDDISESGLFYSNPSSSTQSIQLTSSQSTYSIPRQSTFILGSIADTRHFFSPYTSSPSLSSPTPKFDIILLDPPWPNRSARRSKAYGTSSRNFQIRDLLSSIPIRDLLSEDGLVAVWITNRESFREMVLGKEGLFEGWGMAICEEWCWLKVTSGGEPICALDGVWRKPWEGVLIGRRTGGSNDHGRGEREGEKEGVVKRRIVIGVPDLHSRKPNLRHLFEKAMKKSSGEYQALEIFARYLTAGWWSWGNEVLKFQNDDCWADDPDL
ncbi:uncharacterized protein RSE6_13073 [Rhynchosporium secalis]|uniref:MT-A70-domain-containing protein n=1 Tax=Rhynchosporium secalis TaxID=38038 RepID=A0A1E1MRY8_RHYSE|nr:uncharacterized protein RSE6_13073 [Rhynchosporium secalis]